MAVEKATAVLQNTSFRPKQLEVIVGALHGRVVYTVKDKEKVSVLCLTERYSL